MMTKYDNNRSAAEAQMLASIAQSKYGCLCQNNLGSMGLPQDYQAYETAVRLLPSTPLNADERAQIIRIVNKASGRQLTSPQPFSRDEFHAKADDEPNASKG